MERKKYTPKSGEIQAAKKLLVDVRSAWGGTATYRAAINEGEGTHSFEPPKPKAEFVVEVYRDKQPNRFIAVVSDAVRRVTRKEMRKGDLVTDGLQVEVPPPQVLRRTQYPTNNSKIGLPVTDVVGPKGRKVVARIQVKNGK